MATRTMANIAHADNAKLNNAIRSQLGSMVGELTREPADNDTMDGRSRATTYVGLAEDFEDGNTGHDISSACSTKRGRGSSAQRLNRDHKIPADVLGAIITDAAIRSETLPRVVRVGLPSVFHDGPL